MGVGKIDGTETWIVGEKVRAERDEDIATLRLSTRVLSKLLTLFALTCTTVELLSWLTTALSLPRLDPESGPLDSTTFWISWLTLPSIMASLLIWILLLTSKTTRYTLLSRHAVSFVRLLISVAQQRQVQRRLSFSK